LYMTALVTLANEFKFLTSLTVDHRIKPVY